jgi:prepilin peptidase CpaA
MLITSPLAIAGSLTFVSLCILSDVRSRRIPNALSFTGMLVGVTCSTIHFGAEGALSSLEGAGVAMAILMLPFALGGIGGGDVKMMASVGTFLGPRPTMEGLLLGLVFGGAVMVVHLTRISRLREKLGSLRTMLSNAAIAHSIAPLKISTADQNAVALPYSIPLGFGVATVIAISRLARGG